MKFIIDIGHPAHVHYFRNFSSIMEGKGHEILYTARNKEMTIKLLEFYGFNYKTFGSPYKSKISKIFGLFVFTLKLFIVAIKYKPDFYLHATMYSAFVAWLLRKPHVSLEDTFNMEQVNLYKPFTSTILTGDYPHPPLGKKEIKYSGYQELLYLHPKYFTPNPDIYHKLGISPGTPYVIIRFVSWQASHDFGHQGISMENKLKAVHAFEKHAKVFISSESELQDDLKPYQIKIEPQLMHDAIAYASLIIGESFTMLSEASMLGTPSILIHDTTCYYLMEQELKYGLTFHYSESNEDQNRAIEKGVELLMNPNLKHDWKQKQISILKDNIDVTSFLVWFIENYPDSVKVMKENPDYQYRFK